ncbi:hypothetical protein [Pradoshia sp.]
MQKLKMIVDDLHDCEAKSLLFQILLKIESGKHEGFEEESFTRDLEGLYDHLLYYKAGSSSSFSNKIRQR